MCVGVTAAVLHASIHYERVVSVLSQLTAQSNNTMNEFDASQSHSQLNFVSPIVLYFIALNKVRLNFDVECHLNHVIGQLLTQIGKLPTQLACPLRWRFKQCHSCMDMSRINVYFFALSIIFQPTDLIF